MSETVARVLSTARGWVWHVTIVLVISSCITRSVSASLCPAVCFCPSLSRIVYCPRKGLPFIPSGIPPDTVQLNLNDNKFLNPVISRANFSSYRDLEQLYLTGCEIEYIEVDTFIDNKKLKWLDIGKNKLKTISDFTFRDLTLDHLFLNDNPGVKLSARVFGGLKSTGLYMQNNGLDKLSLEVLRPMNSTLKTLWIDGNKFERFNSKWFYLFKTLSHLRIGDNPLHCNCEAQWLYSFYSTAKIFEGGNPPACRSPGQLRGKPFTELQEGDFKCQLPVFKNVDVIFEENVGKMTCEASGDPLPTIYWMKPDGTSEKFVKKSEDVNKKDVQGIMYVPNPRSKSKNRYQCVANNPAGNVTFSINVAWPTVPAYVPEPDVAMKDMSATDTGIDVPKVDKDIKKHTGGKTESKDKSVESNSSKIIAEKVKTVESAGSEGRFSTGDIVAAVVGTFVLTLLLCAIVFHLYYRHQRKLASPIHHHNGLVPHTDTKRGPPSRHELDEVEHTMLEKRNFDIHV